MDTSIIEHAKKEYATANKESRALLEKLFGAETFKAKITDRIKTIQDACKATGRDYDLIFTSVKHISPFIKACMEWEIIAEALNDGWKPDYSNSSQYKHYPWYKHNKGASGSGLSFYVAGYDTTNAFVGPRLVFKSEELVRYAVAQFPDTFDTFFNQ